MTVESSNSHSPPCHEVQGCTDLKRVRRFGGPISHAALASEHPLFQAEGINGLRLVGRNALVMTDPICAAGDEAKLAKALNDSVMVTQNGATWAFAALTQIKPGLGSRHHIAHNNSLFWCCFQRGQLGQLIVVQNGVDFFACPEGGIK